MSSEHWQSDDIQNFDFFFAENEKSKLTSEWWIQVAASLRFNNLPLWKLTLL